MNRYTTLWAEGKCKDLGKYQKISPIWGESKLLEIKQWFLKEEIGIKGLKKITKTWGAYGNLTILTIWSKLFIQPKGRITALIINARLVLRYETQLNLLALRGKAMIFTAQVLCEQVEKKQEEEQTATMNYFDGIHFLEATTRVPKFYLDRFLVGLRNLINYRVRIEMENINTTIEVNPEEKKITFQL